MIPYSRQSIDKNDIKAINLVLKSRLITQGPILKKFEQNISKVVNSKYATGVNSATSGLHIACLALELKKNDYMWTVPNSYVSSANCGRFCGAIIDFVDIDSQTLNICVKKLSDKLIVAKKKKKLPKIIVVVHFAGNPAEMEKINKLSKKYKFKIIEDASHALGSYIKKNPIGNCRYSDIAVFSFHPVKSITTGEGGMVVTNSKKINDKLKLLRSNGVTRDKKKFIQKNFQPWKYEQHLLGYNYRMNEIQAALGISQLKRLKRFIKKRNQISKKYIKSLNSKNLKFQKIESKNMSSFHLMIVTIKLNKIKKKYNKIFNELINCKIGINLHYFPIHLQPYYKKHCGKIKMQNSENYAKSSFSIPIYYDMKKKEQDFVIKKLNQIIK